jgi:Putative esterase
VVSGGSYAVTVATNPSGQTCTVSGGSGTVASANVTSVAVSCTNAPTYSIGGTVSGLSGTVVLQDNNGDDLSVTANGAFTFNTPLVSGAPYNVKVKTNPSGQTCTVSSGSAMVASANVTSVAVSCTTNSTASASDNFSRPNGGLGPNWTATSDGAMAISSQQVIGTAGATTGEMWTANTFASDQYSQVQVTSTQLASNQWIGPAVRLQNGGQNGYVVIYTWNSGSPALKLFRRNGASWTQLGAYSSGLLAAGTQLKLLAVGSTISFMENGVQKIGASDSIYTGGAPGIMAYGSATAGNWTAGPAGFQVSYQSTNAQGVQSYDVISANNGYGPQVLRVLAPTSPAAGVAHNFLIVLPVEAGLGSSYGDGLATLQALGAQNTYNLTIIEPTFAIDSWYADNPNDAQLQYETFMTQELVPWIKQNLATTGHEQIWLIGFSKSGLGAQDLILRHPDLFTLAASWDFPADMSTYNGLGTDPAANYGTDANYQVNYRLTFSFVNALKRPFLTNNRIWIGGYRLYQTDVSDYDAILTSAGIAHSTETPQYMAHRWDSGWMPIAMTALYQESINLH